jgi:hypothetical protein
MTKSLIIIALATGALAACDAQSGADRREGIAAMRSEAPQSSAGKAGAAEEAQAQVVRRPKPDEVQKRLVGAWSRDKDCGRKLTFSENGDLSAFDGAPGTWSVTGPSADGTMIQMEGEGRIANMEVTLIAQDEVHLRDTDPGTQGNTLYLQRC